MKRTQKQIKQEIEALENQIEDIQNYRKSIPEYALLEDKLKKMREQHDADTYDQIQCWMSDIHALKCELIDKKKENEIEIPSRVQNWFRSYSSGIDWGYSTVKIKWISEDERFVIITRSGSTAGTGTAMGAGGYYYASSRHWIADTTYGKYKHYGSEKDNCYMETEGRLTKELKQQMIDYTETLRKQ